MAGELRSRTVLMLTMFAQTVIKQQTAPRIAMLLVQVQFSRAVPLYNSVRASERLVNQCVFTEVTDNNMEGARLKTTSTETLNTRCQPLLYNAHVDHLSKAKYKQKRNYIYLFSFSPFLFLLQKFDFLNMILFQLIFILLGYCFSDTNPYTMLM